MAGKGVTKGHPEITPHMAATGPARSDIGVLRPSMAPRHASSAAQLGGLLFARSPYDKVGRAHSPPRCYTFGTRDEGRGHGIAPHGHPSRRCHAGLHFHGGGAAARRRGLSNVRRARSELLRGSEKRYLISTPWEQGLPGRLTVCTREEIVDSRGNKTEAGPMTIYEIEGSRIIDSREDDTLFRDYGPLQPVKR
jgi:hypothetical protein